MPKPKPKTKPKDVLADQVVGRDVIYPDVAIDDGEIDADKARDLLGWEEVADKKNALLTDLNGRPIRCLNNVTNRPLYDPTVDALRQEVLMRRWRFNGEPIIVGRTGLILNGQHTLIAVVLAEQARTGPDADHWRIFWDGPVSVRKLVVKGIDESDGVVNTMDTCRPRSLADVIYRSEFFATMGSSDRARISRLLDYAVRMLWHRTGADADAFHGHRTHAESLDFVARHPGLIRAVKHIFEEDVKRSIGRYLSPGYAAGLLYLMAGSKTDPDRYRADPRESSMDLSMFDKAEEFWTLVSAREETLRPMREARSTYRTTGEDGKPVTREVYPLAAESSLAEKIAVLSRGWEEFSTVGKLTPARMSLRYSVDEDGVPHLAETVTIGGIDLGDPDRDGTEIVEESELDEPDEREVEARKAEVKTEKVRDEAPAPTDGKVFLAHLRKKHLGAVLLFKVPTGWKVFGRDVDTLAAVGVKVRSPGVDDGVKHGMLTPGDIDGAVDSVIRAGHQVMKCFSPNDVREAKASAPAPDPKPAPEKKPLRAAKTEHDKVVKAAAEDAKLALEKATVKKTARKK